MAATGLELQHVLNDRRVAPAARSVAAIDPLMTIGALLGCIALFHVPFKGAYLILALLVFSLTFPGRAPAAGNVGALARETLASWSLTVVVLAVIGWATRTVDVFDQRVLLAWLLATPFARVAGQLALPPLLRGLYASRRAQRVAVIVGACELG